MTMDIGAFNLITLKQARGCMRRPDQTRQRQLSILRELVDGEERTLPQIAKTQDMTVGAIAGQVHQMVKNELLRRSGICNKYGYRITEKGAALWRRSDAN